MYQDLREFIERVDQLGALRRIEGADPRYEIGGITEVAAGRADSPALLFDAIKGFQRRHQSAAGRARARHRSGVAAA
jgi:UbiD family decarboxylase